jgi:acetyl-CoA synthetase
MNIIFKNNLKFLNKKINSNFIYFIGCKAWLCTDNSKDKIDSTNHNKQNMSDNLKQIKFDLTNGTTYQEDAEEVFQPPKTLIDESHIPGISKYHEMYNQSIDNPDKFWRSVAKELYFETFSDKGLEWNFDKRKGEIFIRFMNGSKTNIAYNCLERNVKKGLENRIAYYWEGNEPGDVKTLTYGQLLKEVIKFSSVLRSKGVRKGDVVAIYLPMILELPIVMLSCARIGAIHSVVFAGFSADSLASRITHARSRILITADGSYRGNKLIELKSLADKAANICTLRGESLDNIIVVEHLKSVRAPEGSQPNDIPLNLQPGRDTTWNDEMSKQVETQQQNSSVEWMDAEDPLFILYTSGSTGSPKGILHSTAGYMVYTYMTTKCSFDIQSNKDIYWATADCGWITGHSYVVYGPLLNGLTSVIFEGVPSYPDNSRFWSIIEKYKVTKFYTAPTAIRSLMAYTEEFVNKHNCSTLKIIGTVGEPINPTAWKWLYNIIGKTKCAIVDTYWQTETGGHVIVPMPGSIPTKPGSATLPFFGVLPKLVNIDGNIIEGPGEGNLCFSQPWPGIMRSIWCDHERFVENYFSLYPGNYFTGDGARRDDDGYYWITGRMDDLMNVSGHLLSTSEIESALSLHPQVVEAAVVSAPHAIKGHYPYAFVVLSNDKYLTDELIKELKLIVRDKIGAIAIPDIIQHTNGLPKTRSGKITRRILRKIAEGNKNVDLGDTSTLVDETIIEHLWENRLKEVRTTG